MPLNLSLIHIYRETGTQGVSYTTGVPATTGALMLAKGLWGGAGVFNVEQFDPDPFLAVSYTHLPRVKRLRRSAGTSMTGMP